uniref:uncharacterized protein n=1 Tax=Semicossyphus pulcher TaxID=241346 RepID=UPI0037E76AD8
MSDSDLDQLAEDPDLGGDVLPEIASISPNSLRRSARLAVRDSPSKGEAGFLMSQLHGRGITPAPGISLSQLRELAELSNYEQGECSYRTEQPAASIISSPVPTRGRKRTRKSGPSQAPQPKRRIVSCRSPSHAEPTNPRHSSSDSFLVSTLQALNKSMGNIDARLRALENASSATSSSATTSANSGTSMLDVTTPIFRTSPIGVATRKYSGKKRLIFDLSAPRSGPVASVNSLIPPEPFSLHYASVDNAIKLIKLAGQGVWLSKADITDAFKIVPIHPCQWPLFGIRWDSKYYFAVRLTFGCRSSPCIFNLVSEALCWILLNQFRVPSVLHLLDDFLLIDPPHDGSGSSLGKLKHCFQVLGVPLSEEKTVGPDTRLEFLGITLDTIEMKASLPAEKLQRIRDISKSYCAAEYITKQQLLSLLGHLNFAMRVIPQGRSFISRLLEMSSSVHNLHDVISLDEGCCSDLSFWSLLLEHWNGITFFYDDLVHSSDSLKFFTDAAPSVGFGGFFQGQWFADHWPPAFSGFDQSSALYEIYPVAVACHVWGQHWKRKRISVLCDNQAVVSMINRGRSSSKDIMPFLRSITWSSITHNFIITARHVPGHYNKLADSLSRFNFQIFRSICPEASPVPIQVPPLQQLTLF